MTTRACLTTYAAALARVLVVVGLLSGASFALAQEDTFPESAKAAFELYEREYPVEKWLDGPIQYLILPYEQKIWKDLDTDEQRQDFIAWFWGRRDPDPRDQSHPLIDEFYTRVAFANQRFSGFPKGWRSDRGRIWTTLGAPTGGMRRTTLDNFGRCSAREGEWWTYYTNNMAFQAQFGEFNVIFVETRIGQYEICDPTMLGVGGFPADLSRAVTMTKEAFVLDDATEFDPARGVVVVEESVLDAVARTEELTVPAAGWGDLGVAGVVVVPVQLPLSGLLFEPQGELLTANLRVRASLAAVGPGQAQRGDQQWQLQLDSSMARAIGGGSLQTALVLPAEPGGYAATIEVLDPLSGTAWRWEGPVEVSDGGVAVSPPLVGSSLMQLRESGEVGLLGPADPAVTAGEPFAVVSWVRGIVPIAEEVSLQLVTADGEVTELEVASALWGNQAAVGPLVVQSVTDVAPGEYMLRLLVGGDAPVAERRIWVR